MLIKPSKEYDQLQIVSGDGSPAMAHNHLNRLTEHGMNIFSSYNFI